METKEDLLRLIKKKREQMLKIACIHGISSEATIKSSQELDKLIVKYQKHIS